MHQYQYVERLVDLMDPSKNVLLNMSYEAAMRVSSGDPRKISEIDGQFGIVQKQGNVGMARSIGRPMRYF